MPIFQYKCEDCSSVFEQLVTSLLNLELGCVSCGSSEVLRADSTYFYPNKVFCPHTKKVNIAEVKGQLSQIMSDREQSCAGCGVDGAAGSCKSKGGGCSNCKNNCKK